jgi:gliding motility-associated-like protein
MSWAGPVTGDPAGTEITLSGGNYSVNNAPAGLYTITITDANGCVTTTTTTIIEPVLLTATSANTGALCNGSSDGTVTGTATGGTSPYDMSWTGPNTGNPAGTEINADGGSYTVNGAPAGAYTLTMTDANGCTATATTNVAQPLPIVVSSVITPPLCNGATNGELNINVIGGFPGYNVSWVGPISDNPAGIEIVNNGGSYQINNLSAGTFTVVATDVNGCTDSIVSTLIPPPSLSFTAVVSNISCNGGVGSILVTASNGTPGYDVSWVGPITSNPVGTEINVSGGTYTITAITAGNYQITVTDQNGCFDSSSVTLLEPTLIQSTSIETSTLCQNSNDGSTQVTVSGGVSPYNLSLTGSVSLNPIGNEITVSGGNYTFSNLAAGNYTVTVLDANNCSSTLAITILAGNILPVITLVGDTICTGQSATLNASATPVGGTFLWGNGTSNSSITISPILTTQYAVLYNYSGCMSQLTVSVVVYPIPTVSVANATICEGQSATLSAASMQPIGGTFLWSTGATTSTISVSPQNTTNYSLVYTLNGCSSPSASATVSVNPIPQLTINNGTICEGDSVILTANPNLPGGTILWTPNGETTNSITANPSVTSTYSAVYTLNGCPSSSFSTNVTVNPIPVVSFDADLLQGCAPLTSNFWNSSANANQSTNTQWFIEGNPVAVGDSTTLLFSNAGCYDITLEMTVNGCLGSQTSSNFVCVEGIPVASFSADINYFTEPIQNATFTNNSVGATTYFWNTGDGNTYTTENVSHLFNNTGNGYTIWLTAMSDLGCVDSTSINIPFMDEIVYFIPNSFTPDGDEFNNIFTPVFTAGIDYHTYEMTIFNRWGEIVFETQDPLTGWDGSYGNQGLDVQLGVYTYKISFKTPQFDDRREILGHVNVVR